MEYLSEAEERFYKRVFTCSSTTLTRAELESFPCPFCTKNVSDDLMKSIVNEMDAELKKYAWEENSKEWEFEYEGARYYEMDNAATKHKVPYYEDLGHTIDDRECKLKLIQQ